MGHLTGEDLPLEETALVVAEHSLASTADQHRACFDDGDFSGYNVLRVVYTDAPISLFDWEHEYGVRPYFGRIIVAAQPRAVEDADPPRDDVGAVLSNRDLRELGTTITKAVDAMSGANDRPVHLCFDGVDTMLKVAGESNTFQFLRLTIELLESTEECGGHFHFDPSGSTKEELITIQQLFDNVVDLERRHDRATNTTGATSEFDH